MKDDFDMQCLARELGELVERLMHSRLEVGVLMIPMHPISDFGGWVESRLAGKSYERCTICMTYFLHGHLLADL